MSAATITLTNVQIPRSPRHTATIYLKEAKYEFLKNLRLRMYTASVLSFPIMFYVLFGLVLNSKQAIGGTAIPTYLIATYGTFGVMGASLFGTAAGLASDRGLGWLQVKRASPMPPFAYFAAKVITSMTFSAVIVLALFALGTTLGGVRMPVALFARLLGTLVAGSLPFSAMGLAVGYFGAQLGASDYQSDLSAHVVLQRPVGTVHVLAEGGEADRTGAASLSLVATRLGCRRRGDA